MKFITAFTLTLLLLGCKNETTTQKSATSEENVQEQTNSEDITDGFNLKQNGDYSSLFNLEKGDCSFISMEDMAEALTLSESNIADVSLARICKYNLTLSDGSIWTVIFQWHSFSKAQITKEIGSYMDDSSPLLAQISETKDTYLCIHPFNKFLMLYNNNYDGAIQITYCQAEVCSKLTKEQNEARKEMAITLANFLLEKHKK